MNLVLTLNTAETDPRLARVVSPADLARLAVPVFAYGDTVNCTVYLIRADGSYDPKSTQVDLARALKIGVRGQTALVEATDFAISGNGVTCTLALTTVQLALVLRAQGSRGLALQYRTTSPTDGLETWLSADLTILGEVEDPTDGVDLSSDVYLTLAQAAALYSPRGAGSGSSANAAGTTTITPGSTKQSHTEVTTFSGAAGTRSIVLDLAGRVEGDRILHLCALPSTAGIVINWYSGDTSGDPIATRTTDDSGDDLAAEFLFTGGAWRKLWIAYPA